MKRFILSALITLLLCTVSCGALAEKCSACARIVPNESNFCIYCGQLIHVESNLYTQGHTWAIGAGNPKVKKIKNGVEVTVQNLGSMLGFSTNPVKLKRDTVYHVRFKIESEQNLTLNNNFEHNVQPYTKYHSDTISIQANTVRECIYVVPMVQSDDNGELAIVFQFTNEQLKLLKLPFRLKIYDIIISEIN